MHTFKDLIENLQIEPNANINALVNQFMKSIQSEIDQLMASLEKAILAKRPTWKEIWSDTKKWWRDWLSGNYPGGRNYNQGFQSEHLEIYSKLHQLIEAVQPNNTRGNSNVTPLLNWFRTELEKIIRKHIYSLIQQKIIQKQPTQSTEIQKSFTFDSPQAQADQAQADQAQADQAQADQAQADQAQADQAQKVDQAKTRRRRRTREEIEADEIIKKEEKIRKKEEKARRKKEKEEKERKEKEEKERKEQEEGEKILNRFESGEINEKKARIEILNKIASKIISFKVGDKFINKIKKLKPEPPKEPKPESEPKPKPESEPKPKPESEPKPEPELDLGGMSEEEFDDFSRTFKID
jgi:hypothetical protein